MIPADESMEDYLHFAVSLINAEDNNSMDIL